MNKMDDTVISNTTLLKWMDVLEFYARDWDAVFANRPHYFTQEYWYLFMGVITAEWQGRPMTITGACQVMKTGSARTREDRVKKAVQDGYLVKEHCAEDKRTILVKPTPLLENLIRKHLEQTYQKMTELMELIPAH